VSPRQLTPDSVAAASRVADAWLALRRRVLQVPGVQAAVLFSDLLTLDTAHGWADVENEVRLSKRHLFRIASHSKTFTATAVMQLVETGRMRLDDTLGEHVPAVRDEVARVTVRELLSHGAGVIRDGANADYWVLGRPFPDADELRSMTVEGAGVLPPNERFKYSNVGYALLGQVIEGVTGRPYGDVMKDQIIDRLGLQDTAPELDAGRLGDYAVGYSSLVYADRRVPIEHVDTKAMAPATGFGSTAADLVHYAAAHAYGDDRLLSDASKRIAQREEWDVGGEDEGHYGLGFEVLYVDDRRMVGHGGGYPGHATKTMLDPLTGLAVSVLTNAIDGPAAELATGVVKLVNLAADPGSEQRGTDDLDRFTGAFASLAGRLDIVRFGSRLVGLRLHQPDPTHLAIELTPVDATTLQVSGGGSGYGAYGELMRYAFDDSGSVRSVRGPGGAQLHRLGEFAASLDDIEILRAPAGS